MQLILQPSSIPNSQPTGVSNNNNAAATPSSAAHALGVPGVAGAGAVGILAAFLM